MSVFHRARRPFPEGSGPHHNEETGEQGEKRLELRTSHRPHVVISRSGFSPTPGQRHPRHSEGRHRVQK